jgi:aminoglycoside phosphotransferase (APT) family kinase protein
VDKAAIDADLVARLIASQFPQWADLAVTPVERDGWDNSTFRLGPEMSVRMPTRAQDALSVDKEQRWLPLLARGLPLPIPRPLARGEPGLGFPRPWSVYSWLPGDTLEVAPVQDDDQLARDLGNWLSALYKIDATGGPSPGVHNWGRGGPIEVYDADARKAFSALEGLIDTDRARAVMDAAVAATWPGPPVWFHGDVAAGNLLVEQGRLSAVIDFGTCGVGDPACDCVIAWTHFGESSRALFKAALPFDEATWARGRGWGLWKAAIVLVRALDTDPLDAAATRNVIEAILDDDQQSQPSN